MKTPVLVEGYSPDEILDFPIEQIVELVFTGEPILFKAGTAQVLGEFTVEGQSLVVALAQIEGGGEGVLPTLWVLAERLAHQMGLKQIEWIVHAINCAKPNPKLRPFLERRGFVIEQVRGQGEAYHFIKTLNSEEIQTKKHS